MNDWTSSISFSRVKLAVNRETQQAIAVKIIDLEKAADCYDNVRKEVSGVNVACKIWIEDCVQFLTRSFVYRFVFIECFKMSTLFDFMDRELKERNSTCSWNVLLVENCLTE